MNTKTKGILVVVALIVIAALLAFTGHSSSSSSKTIATVTYSCDKGQGIVATFYSGPTKPAAGPNQPPTPGGSALVKLSDGRTFTLNQTISADGGRYSNGDPNIQQGQAGAETFVFWGKGNTAVVLENNQLKDYTGCIALAPDQSGVSLPLFYSNSSAEFSIRFPQGYSVDEAYKYQELGPGKDIVGVKFTIPTTTAAGTNLGSDSYLSVEEIPKVQDCSAALFLDGVTAKTITDANGVTYSVASSTGAGAGNRYEEAVYALPGTNPCTAVRYFIHYGVIENYPPGAVRQFDEQALLTQFDAMRRAVVIAQ